VTSSQARARWRRRLRRRLDVRTLPLRDGEAASLCSPAPSMVLGRPPRRSRLLPRMPAMQEGPPRLGPRPWRPVAVPRNAGLPSLGDGRRVTRPALIGRSGRSQRRDFMLSFPDSGAGERRSVGGSLGPPQTCLSPAECPGKPTDVPKRTTVLHFLIALRGLGRALVAVWRDPETKALPLIVGLLLLTGRSSTGWLRTGHSYSLSISLGAQMLSHTASVLDPLRDVRPAP
jgi:hypothetical protein